MSGEFVTHADLERILEEKFQALDIEGKITKTLEKFFSNHNPLNAKNDGIDEPDNSKATASSETDPQVPIDLEESVVKIPANVLEKMGRKPQKDEHLNPPYKKMPLKLNHDAPKNLLKPKTAMKKILSKQTKNDDGKMIDV